ncbi:MAG: hypothetical protein WCK48_01855 [bacterium]
MFNVLPNFFKEEIKSEYKIRFWIVVVLFVIFIQISFLVMIFPSWLISLARQNEVTTELDATNKSSSYQNADKISTMIEDTNQKLKIIDSALTYPRFVPIVRSILDNKISGIKLNSILFSSTGSNTVALTGISSTRETLVLFIKKLKDSGLFKDVFSPVSNFTKDKDIGFSINIILQ